MNRSLRYCELCDEFFRSPRSECPRCGADTRRAIEREDIAERADARTETEPPQPKKETPTS